MTDKHGKTPLPLPPYKIIFSPSSAVESDDITPQQPHTAAIAHYSSSPPPHPTGTLLDVNTSYVVYAVKNGLIRVLDRKSALRTLLRGHTTPVGNITFFGQDMNGSTNGGMSDVLGTVAGEPDDAANVLIWRIFTRENELASEKLLEIRFKEAVRLIWHPFNPNQFLLVHRKKKKMMKRMAVATLVESTRIATVPHESEGHALCLCKSSSSSGTSDGDGDEGENQDELEEDGSVIDGALQLFVPSSSSAGNASVNDISWSGVDARHVLSGHDDGCVRLWDVRGRMYVNANGEEVAEEDDDDEGGADVVVSAKCLMTVRVCCQSDDDDDEVDNREINRHAVTRCFFLSKYDDATSNAEGTQTTLEAGSYLTPPFITATANNTTITLWSPFSTTGSPPTKIREFELDGGPRDVPFTLNLALCTGPTMSDQPPSTFLLLADKNEGNLYALHLRSQWRQHTDAQQHTTKMAVLTGFDYVTPFRVVYPIYSWTITSSPVTSEDDDEDNVRGRSRIDQFEIRLFCVQSKAVQMLTLTPSMCSSPTPVSLTDGEPLPNGVRVEIAPIHQNIVTDNEEYDQDYDIAEDDYQEEGIEDVEYDEYDDEDGEDVEQNEQDEEDNHQDRSTPPPASALPPPGWDSGPTPTSDRDNPFANWLGAIAASTAGGGKSGAARGILPPAPPTTPATPATTGLGVPGLPPGLMKSAVPPPPIGMDTTAVLDTVEDEETESATRQGSGFLSPMEFLKTESSSAAAAAPTKIPAFPDSKDFQEASDMDKAIGALPSATAESKIKQQLGIKVKQQKRSITPKKEAKSGGKGSVGMTKKSSKMGTPPVPMPVAPGGKIAILKRDDKLDSTAAEEQQNSNVPPSATSAPTPAISTSSIEEAVRKSLASYFKKHEVAVMAEIQKSVRDEMQTAVLPALSKTVTQTMDQSVTKPLQASLSKNSKESTKVRTKEVVDAISESVKYPVEEAFHESMKNVMIPAYEAATREMFAQVSKSLDQGLQAQQRSNNTENTTKLVESMSMKMDAMAKAIEDLSGEVANLLAIVASSGGDAAVRTVPQPQPPVDRKKIVRDEVLALLNNNDYEIAFTRALSASTADMAVFACKNSDLSTVLGGNSPALSQPILLCLMQQLGAALISSSDSDLKTELAWLQDIALTLDPNDESIKRHVKGVVQQLVANINALMAKGEPALRRPLQVLLQVIRGIGVV